MQPLRFQLNTTDNSAVSADVPWEPATNFTEDHISNVSHSIWSDNSTEKHVSKALKKEFEQLNVKISVYFHFVDIKKKRISTVNCEKM